MHYYEELFLKRILSGRKKRFLQKKREIQEDELMKKMKKVAAVVVALSMIMVLLCGCEGLAKRKALADYGQQLQSDVPLWNDLSEVSKQTQSSNDMTTMKALIQSRILPDLEKISIQANARHGSIGDTELQTIDNDYVTSVDHMKEAYSLILDGINTSDQAKLNKAMNELTVTMNSMQDYATGLQAYCKKYNIQDSNIENLTDAFK